MINKENTSIGKRFEREVINDVNSRNPIHVDTNVVMNEIGVEFDVVSYFDDKIEFIEAKGGEKDCKSGKGGGALRTDNVKKAIANGALLKSIKPDSIYVIYFSHEPNYNSRSDLMLKSAISAGYVDEVRILKSNVGSFTLENFFD
jgi:hypothetical protein